MTTLAVWLDTELVGHLHHEPQSNQFAFTYTQEWQGTRHHFPLSPVIPLRQTAPISAELHSAHVRQFFENILPEGDALDVAAQANRVSKSNLVGLMIALGKETAGALRISSESNNPTEVELDSVLREVTRAELSKRIDERQHIPFSQWDGKVRLSIAGYQDKIAVYKKENQWFLVDGPQFASTHIVKPIPQRSQLASLPANEFFCMKLAGQVGLAVADVELEYVPQPVLFVKRFDRIDHGTFVKRLHVIDACQALGYSVAMKYERPYGDSRDVKDIRDGVSYQKLFHLINQSASPAKDRLALLRWVLFQVLIGNHDAHGKNLSFFMNDRGLQLAPAYDLICIPVLKDEALSANFGMAIGDAFTENEINQAEWLAFAHDCGISPNLVTNTLLDLTQAILKALPKIAILSRENVIAEEVITTICNAISTICLRQQAVAQHIKNSG